MKKQFRDFILLAFVVVVSWAAWEFLPGTLAHASGVGASGSGVGGMPSSPVFSGTVSSTKACAAGFARIGTNYCHSIGVRQSISWVDAVACTARSTGAILPADAKIVVGSLWWQARAGNAVALRENTVYFHDSSACTSFESFSKFSILEMVANVAGTNLGESSLVVFATLAASNTFYTAQANAGGNGFTDVQGMDIIGYYD